MDKTTKDLVIRQHERISELEAKVENLQSYCERLELAIDRLTETTSAHFDEHVDIFHMPIIERPD